MPKMKSSAILLLLSAICAFAEIRLGIIGTDTSHVIAFTKILNDPTSPDYVPGARVVAAFKGGSADVESSYTRVDKFAEELKTKWRVEFSSDIPSLCRKVDGILLESVDGRVHLEQVKPVIAAHKPVFIDKPLAATLEDAREIARLAKEADVPWFSASDLRFTDLAIKLKFPDITGALTWGPGPLEPHHHLDLSWYAIHAVELLYALMGSGCEEVTRTYTPDADVIVGKWKDGRLGSVRALRPYGKFGAVVFRPDQKVNQSDPKSVDTYRPLLVEIVKFFETKEPPFPNQQTLEEFAFMDAAQRSREAGGAPMKLR
jgi:Oxidoreductase family, NAD-binding Rossmann fold